MSSHSSRDTFFYLLQFVTLAISATALGNVWFSFINKWTTSLTPYERFQPNDVTAGLSALVIAAPVYLGLSWWIRKAFADGSMQPSSSLRKWLVYFTVFVTSIIGLVDLIATLHVYLNGDFTLRFFFKALSILVIAGSIFVFYLWDIRRENAGPSAVTHAAFWITIVVVLATIIAGFVVVGSPKTRRLLQWDQERVNTLENIVREFYHPTSYPKVGNFVTEGAPLPENSSGFASRFRDPQTQQLLEYRKVDLNTFEVCATFALAAEETNQLFRPYPRPVYPYDAQPEFTPLENHSAGHQCFRYTAPHATTPDKK